MTSSKFCEWRTHRSACPPLFSHATSPQGRGVSDAAKSLQSSQWHPRIGCGRGRSANAMTENSLISPTQTHRRQKTLLKSWWVESKMAAGVGVLIPAILILLVLSLLLEAEIFGYGLGIINSLESVCRWKLVQESRVAALTWHCARWVRKLWKNRQT